MDESRRCLNCSTVLGGDYCHRCGQAARDPYRSFGTILRDTAGYLLSLDSRVASTVIMLMFRPGQLTLECLEGRRARYVPPLRLYLVLSALLFVLMAWTNQTIVTIHDSAAGGKSDSIIQVSTSNGDQPADPAPGSTTETHPPSKAVDEGSTWGDRLGERIETATDDTDALDKAVLSRLPHVLFVLVPVFALILRLVYWNSGRVYAQHLVFSLHLHSFVFILMLAGLLTGLIIPKLDDLLMLPILVYLPMALRRVHERSRWRTALDVAMLSLAYLVCLVVGMAAAFLIAVFTL